MQSVTEKCEYKADCAAAVKARNFTEAANATMGVSDLL